MFQIWNNSGLNDANMGWGLSDTFPLDYVFRGAEVVYGANVEFRYEPLRWNQRIADLNSKVGSHYQILAQSHHEQPGELQNLFFKLRINGDMGSIDHIRQTIDGAAISSGLPVKASYTRFLSNPRRDGTVQPPVNTPGVPPPVTKLPPQAGNVDTDHNNDTVLGNALDFYLGGVAKTLNISTTTTALILVAVIAGVIVIAKR